MSRSHNHIVMRTDPRDGWVAIRMCDDQELFRAYGPTWDQARRNLRSLSIPAIAAQAFDSRFSPQVKAENQIK